MKVKKLSVAAAGAMFSAFALGMQAAHAHAGHSHSASSDSFPSSSSSADSPLNSNSIFYGEPLPLGNATIRSFVKLDGDGNPSDIGVTFSQAALDSLPNFPTYPYQTLRLDVLLPPEASATPFSHVEFLYWNQGHDPGIPGVIDFFEGHVDFSFFRPTPEERDLICPTNRIGTPGTISYECTGEEAERVLQQPEPGAIPTDFTFLPPDAAFRAVPRVGTVLIDSTEAYNPISSELFYGFNEGEMVFIDATFTNDAFNQISTQPGGGIFTEPIKQPAGLIYPEEGYYPTTYSLAYDGASEYTVSLGGLTFRTTSPTSVPEHSSTLSLLGLGALGAVAQLMINRKKTEKQELASSRRRSPNSALGESKSLSSTTSKVENAAIVHINTTLSI